MSLDPQKPAVATRLAAGTAFLINDSVVAYGREGRVVGNISTGDFAQSVYPGAWGLLTAGVLVEWPDGSLSHYREPATSLRRLA